MLQELVEVFRTPRLLVRRWLASDLPVILEVYGDPNVVQWVGDGSPLTLEQAQKWLEITALNYTKRNYGMFTIVDHTSQRIVGFGGLVHPGGTEVPELKYAFMKQYWGQGFASEFVRNALVFARDQLNIQTLVATTYPENAVSKAILLKCGFIQEEELSNDDGTKSCFFVWNSVAR